LHTTPTSFPYTTLFLSRDKFAREELKECDECHSVVESFLERLDFYLLLRKVSVYPMRERSALDILPFFNVSRLHYIVTRKRVFRDRKSTRLNSSHVSIS